MTLDLSEVRECKVQWGTPTLTVPHTLEKGYIKLTTHQNAGTEIGFLLPDIQVWLNLSPEIRLPGILNRCSKWEGKGGSDRSGPVPQRFVAGHLLPEYIPVGRYIHLQSG